MPPKPGADGAQQLSQSYRVRRLWALISRAPEITVGLLWVRGDFIDLDLINSRGAGLLISLVSALRRPKSPVMGSQKKAPRTGGAF